MKNKIHILFTLSSLTDLAYFNTVLKKINKFQFNIILITQEYCIQSIFLKKIIIENNIKVLTLKLIDLKITEILKNKIKPKIVYYFNYLKLRKFFFKKKIIRSYFFNEFHNSITFQVLPFVKQPIFIRTIPYCKITNIKDESEFVSQFGNKFDPSMIKQANKNIKFYKNLFKINLLSSKYELDGKYFKKGNIYNYDFYKVVGFSIKDNFKQVQVNPNFPIKKVKTTKDSILFLFGRLEDMNNFGINFELSYRNMFKYIKKLNKPVTIKLHPNFLIVLDGYLKELINDLNATIINDNNNAEFYMSDYKYIITPIASNAFKVFSNIVDTSRYKLISLLDLVEFEDKVVQKKLQQVFYTVNYNNHKSIIRPKISDLSS